MPPGFDPLRIIELASGFTEPMPSIIEFCLSDRYLNRPNLYPRQATLLKIMFLQKELFTQYDYDVIGEWTQSYLHTADERGQGNNGIVPDVLERIDICLAQGRKWFRQTSNISGRRGSKGHVGGQAGAYVLWNYMSLGDPQGYYGVDRDKTLAAMVFAGKKEQAVKNQWGDLNSVILGANCFTPYISKPLGESLSIYAPHDFERMYERWERGVYSAGDMASIEVLAKESTIMAARGPAAFMQFYDEFAHVTAATAKASAEDVWTSATPSLDQFGQDAFIYIPTSPWQKIGQAYVEYEQSIEKNEDGSVKYPEKLMVQLTSWDIYKDWERANDLRTEPDGMRFQPLRNAIQNYDDQMRQLEKANPETFRVERRAHWATVMDAYLNPERVKDLWKPWPTEADPLVQQIRGRLDLIYRAHGDPSKSGAGFGFAMGHIAGTDERGLPHVIFDQIRVWEPSDYESGEIDYDDVESDLEEVVKDFMPGELTFDQFNSIGTIQRLQKFALKMELPKRVSIYERTATGPLNWKTYETFKTALNMGLLHGPYMEKADLELTFLQDLGGKVEHPTSGPVQTKDVADCLAIVTYELIGSQMSAFIGKSLGELPLGMSALGGVDAYAGTREPEHAALSGFGRSRMPQGGRYSPSRGPRRR